jgi:hypothetical protein
MAGEHGNNYLLCSDPGFYVKISQDNSWGPGARDFTLMLPYADNFQIGNHQNIIKPVEKFLTELKDFMASSADFMWSKSGAAVEAIGQIQDLFGFKLSNKWYYASTWAGQEPASFSLNLKFRRGIAGKWSAVQEVYRPIMDFYARTIAADVSPAGSNTFANAIMAPMPSSAAALTTYAANIVGDASTGLAQLGTAATTVLGMTPKGTTDSVTSVISSLSTGVNKLLMNKTWKVDFGWCNGTSDTFSPYFSIKDVIISDSSFNFGEGVEKSSIGARGYPISGEVTLALISETIMTNSDIYAVSK